MGPILQERTASTALKRVPVREKVRVKNSENNGTFAAVTSSKRGGKVNQNRAQKKPGTLNKNVSPGQEKESTLKAETGFLQSGNRASNKSPVAGNRKLPSTQGEVDLKLQRHTRSPTQRGEEKRTVQHQPLCCSEVDQSHVALGRNRRALSLPLAPQPMLHQGSLQRQVPDLESLRLFEQNEDDTDSASDLSDSERLPVLPSPCTPPQLNLRAEVINSMDLHPPIPGPRTVENDSYSYPDFLPQPFNTWSLRQLAIFLNTEGKGAPRPRPVGQLEKYLERLLQLEWHQIQTIQAESGRSPAPNIRPRGQTPCTPVNASRPRPHTAPPTRLSSPKSLQQCQRAFPFTLLSSLTSPSSSQLSRPVCPHCHIRYPLCNGTCNSYAYQRHSRLSPLLERRARPAVTQKRSSSESRASTSDSRTPARGQDPGSPQMGRSHQKHMQAAGNIRRPSQDLSANSKAQPSIRKSRAGKRPEADEQKDPMRGKSGGAEKRVLSANKREVIPMKRGDKDGHRTEAGGGVPKSGAKRMVIDNCSLSKGTPSTRPNGKVKNVHFVTK